MRAAKRTEPALPSAPDAEKGVLSSMLLRPAEVVPLAIEKGLVRESFYVPAHGEIFDSVCGLVRQEKPVDFITLARDLQERQQLDVIGGPAALNELFIYLPTAAHFDYYADIVLAAQTQRRTRVLLEQMQREVAEGIPLNGALTELVALQSSGSWKATLDALRFDAAKPPPSPPPIYTLDGHTIATAGNVIAVQAQAKAGKTAFLGAMLAAPMSIPGDERDTFSVRSDNAQGHAVIHFDTEQSISDHHLVIARALRRTGLPEGHCPAWLRSYCVTGLPLGDRKAAIRFELDRAKRKLGGIHSVFIDGIGDLCADPNDPEEAFSLVDEMHRLAIKFETVIICVLHENPGSEIGKTRGHLGSQLERKAESNVRLEKSPDGITSIFVERGRHCHIPKEQGITFEWDNEARMHASCQSTGNRKTDRAVEESRRLAMDIWDGISKSTPLLWKDIRDAISNILELKPDAARKRLEMMIQRGVVRHSDGRYYLVE